MGRDVAIEQPATSAHWRRPGGAFALSLALHALLLGGAAWLLGVPDGAPRGERLLSVALAPAPVAAADPQPPAPVAAPAADGAADGARTAIAPEPAPAAAAPPAAVLAAEADLDEDAERRRREALAARGIDGIAPPAHSQASPAAAAPAMPAGAPPGADAAVQRGFVELHVLDWLAQHRSYPRAARRAGLEGTVHVRFVIDPEGRIASAAIERSSGARVLDQAALDLLGRASPVPGLAQFGLAQALELRLPIDYRLRRGARAG
jgi:protein TonB